MEVIFIESTRKQKKLRQRKVNAALSWSPRSRHMRSEIDTMQRLVLITCNIQKHLHRTRLTGCRWTKAKVLQRPHKLSTTSKSHRWQPSQTHYDNLVLPLCRLLGQFVQHRRLVAMTECTAMCEANQRHHSRLHFSSSFLIDICCQPLHLRLLVWLPPYPQIHIAWFDHVCIASNVRYYGMRYCSAEPVSQWLPQTLDMWNSSMWAHSPYRRFVSFVT